MKRGLRDEGSNLRWLIDRTSLKYTTTLSYPKPIVTKLLTGKSGKWERGVLNDRRVYKQKNDLMT